MYLYIVISCQVIIFTMIYHQLLVLVGLEYKYEAHMDEFKTSSADESPVENLWIKVTKGCNKYIIGAIYQRPGCD